MPSYGGPRQVRFAVPASSMSPTMARSGSRSPTPSMEVLGLNTDLPPARSPGWRFIMRQMLADPEYELTTSGSRSNHRDRPSDQYQWDADDLASLRQDRMGRELERELSMAADLWEANQAAFEAAARAGAYGFADSDTVTIGQMLQRRFSTPVFMHGVDSAEDHDVDMDVVNADEDYDSDMHSHLAFGMEWETPTSSTSSVDFEGAQETHRLSLEIPVAHSAAEIMSNSAGSEDNYMSDSSPISVPDSEVQPSTPMSDATDDSEWVPTESSATTPGSDMSHASDTDDNLLTFDDLTNTVDAICALLEDDSYGREAFLSYAYVLVSHVDEEFDNVQIDYLATRLQNFQNDRRGENPISFIADLCRVLGLLGGDGRIPPDVFGS